MTTPAALAAPSPRSHAPRSAPLGAARRRHPGARQAAARTFALGAAGVLAAGCGGGGSRGGGLAAAAVTSAAPSAVTSAGAAPATSAVAAPPSGAALAAGWAADVERRRLAYLEFCVTPPAGSSEGVYQQVARLTLGRGPLDRRPIDASIDVMARRPDTADFGATSLVRLYGLHAQHPLVPADVRDRIRDALVGFKYWIDQPGRDDMCYWSENHAIMFASCEYLAGTFFPSATFTNDGLSGDEHRRLGLARVRRWLAQRLRTGLVEWNSPVYYAHTLSPLLNLVDLAPDPDVAAQAAMVVDLLLFDVARFSCRGSMGATAGRAYEEYKLSGRPGSMGDVIEVVWGSRGGFSSRSSTGGVPFATSRYRVPHALLAIGHDPNPRVERARVGLAPAEGPAAGVGLTDLDDGLYWWSQGAYFHPDTIALTHRMLTTWGLWGRPEFGQIAPLRHVPPALLPGLASTLSPLSEGSVLGPVHLVGWRAPEALLTSAQSYRPGQVGFQQHAWQATLGLDACVFTTAPATMGRDGPGEWTGSASLPRVVQVENAAVILYNPGGLVRTLFPGATHAWFPRAAFDEVVERNGWVFGRKDDGYVALWSARPLAWAQLGPYADKEVFATGHRNAWACRVGRRADDGDFADFMDAVLQGPIALAGDLDGGPSDPLEVTWAAPGVGTLIVPWRGEPLRDAAVVPQAGFPRHDGPSGRQAWLAPALELEQDGLRLRHDVATSTRTGDGL